MVIGISSCASCGRRLTGAKVVSMQRMPRSCSFKLVRTQRKALLTANPTPRNSRGHSSGLLPIPAVTRTLAAQIQTDLNLDVSYSRALEKAATQGGRSMDSVAVSVVEVRS